MLLFAVDAARRRARIMTAAGLHANGIRVVIRPAKRRV